MNRRHSNKPCRRSKPCQDKTHALSLHTPIRSAAPGKPGTPGGVALVCHRGGGRLADPFEEGDLGLLSDVGLPEAVLGVILDETDLYADEQLGRIAREMGFAEELSAVLDRLGR